MTEIDAGSEIAEVDETDNVAVGDALTPSASKRRAIRPTAC